MSEAHFTWLMSGFCVTLVGLLIGAALLIPRPQPEVFTLDGCQYIRQRDYEAVSVIHKANCTNHVHE